MESLNKNQFILLVLLVTFVTSIATGIMTFSLLQEAPVEVTRTINQVIEKTIDQVAPTTGILTGTTGQPDKTTTTVVVNESDQVISAINKNLQSVVRIEDRDSSGGSVNFYGIGVVVSKTGQIVTPRQSIIPGNVYLALLADGSTIQVNPVGADKNTSFILFVPFKSATTTIQFIPATFASADPQLGQTLVALGGDTTNAVAVGRAISFGMKDVTVASTTAKIISSIETDVSTKDVVPGSPLFNLSGDIVGFEPVGDVSKTFESVNILKRELPTLIQAIP